MRIQIMLAAVTFAAMAVADASAQEINLSGPYQCVVNCAGPPVPLRLHRTART